MVCIRFYTLDIFSTVEHFFNLFLIVILPSLTRKRIFGLALFLTFFCGAPIGPLFDAYGPRLLVVCGSVLLIASMFLLGLCTREWPYHVVCHANSS
jgi:MFS family permease